MTAPEERNPLQARNAPADEGWLPEIVSIHSVAMPEATSQNLTMKNLKASKNSVKSIVFMTDTA